MDASVTLPPEYTIKPGDTLKLKGTWCVWPSMQGWLVATQHALLKWWL